MDLDELKHQWAAHDRKLDALIRLNRRAFATGQLDRARTALRRLAAVVAVELLINLVAVGALGGFLAVHAGELRFVVPAVALDAGAIALVSGGVRQLVAMARIDHGQPVAAIQHQLAELARLRLRLIRGTFLLAPLAWTPLLVVGLAALGIDAYRVLAAGYLLANLAFGIAAIPLALWLSRRWLGRLEHAPRARWLARHLIGASLRDAADFVAAIAEFDREISA